MVGLGSAAEFAGGEVDEEAGNDDEGAEEEAVHAENGFAFAADHGEADEGERKDPGEDGTG